MSTDERDQPPLPFEPALNLVVSPEQAEPMREVSFDTFTALLFEEFSRRSVAVRERDRESGRAH